mmetsp:Transcript_24716/g.25347  ORF Transcript_24716/g.25347 Transcript_24716/m.25347 type:complete len:155 (+) Transcript_24716:47-511(+)
MAESDLSLTRLYFGIFWDFVFYILMTQIIVVGLLIVPLPSNKLRGLIINTLDGIWNASAYFRHFCVILSLILALICAASMHAWATLDKQLSNKNFCSLMEAERNVYMTGFSLFLNVMAIRLLEVSRQLHDTKAELKATLKQIDGNESTETKKSK